MEIPKRKEYDTFRDGDRIDGWKSGFNKCHSEFTKVIVERLQVITVQNGHRNILEATQDLIKELTEPKRG